MSGKEISDAGKEFVDTVIEAVNNPVEIVAHAIEYACETSVNNYVDNMRDAGATETQIQQDIVKDNTP